MILGFNPHLSRLGDLACNKCMANNQRRMIYTKIWTSEQFGKLSDRAKLLFIGSITLADDDGRLRGNPAYLRGQVFPYDENMAVSEVLRLRNEVEKSGLISVYSIDGCEYIQHPKWTDYQIIRKDLYKGSTLPIRNEAVTKPLRKRATSQVKLSQVKLSQIAETSSAGITQIIKEFETVDPKNKTYYGNTTQRKACSFLIEEYGLDRVLEIIVALPQINVIPFSPQSTTPSELMRNWVKLENIYKKKKSELSTKSRGLEI